MSGKYSEIKKWPIVENIEIRTLDSFDLTDVDFIKIDVEGFELPVVQGAEETICRCKPHMVVEQKGNESAYGGAKNEAAEFLYALGMKDLTIMAGDHIMGW